PAGSRLNKVIPSPPGGRPRLGLVLALDETVVAVGGQVVPVLLLAVGPGDGQPADLGRLAQAEDVARVAGRGVAAAPLGGAPLGAAAGPQADAGADPAAVVLADQLHAQPVVAGRRHVAQHRHGVVGVADDGIDAAVVVEVAQGQAAAEVGLVEV